MTTNEPNTPDDDDRVIDITVNVNASDRLIDAIVANVDIVPRDNNVDDAVIELLITLRDAPDDVRKAIVDDTLINPPTDD